jgi:Ca-activated chloride channel homolog
MLQLNETKLDALQRLMVLGSLLVCLPGLARAQAAGASDPGGSRPERQRGEFTIRTDVNLVVLHATVLDHHGKMVNDLKQNNFQVYENNVQQKLSVFSHADIPVTMGIVIDDSGSMRSKRQSVSAAALTFVKTSNPQDQVFVVNFNDNYYLDTPGDFAQNMEELKAALEKIDSRGGTALRDALMASIDHLKLGNRDKKVILVVTDGEDNESRYTLEELLKSAQNSNAVIYCIGLLGDEEPGGLFKKNGEAKRAAKALKDIAEATGGQAYFPKSLDEVEPTCVKIARDIRNQYTLGYYPTNRNKDGTYRTVRVEAFSADKHRPLEVRTRTGYFAPKTTPTPESPAAGR